jgi:hypothetical protein
LRNQSARVTAGTGLAALASASWQLASGNCLTGASAIFVWIFIAIAVADKSQSRVIVNQPKLSTQFKYSGRKIAASRIPA